MLILLEIVFVLFIAVSLILTRKDFLSPTFLLACAFVICDFFAILGNRFWNVDISIDVISLFVLIFGFILVGEICANRIGYCRQVCIFSPYQVSKENNRIFLVFLFVIVQSIILYLYYSRLIAMATFVGFSGVNLPMYVRVATIRYGMHVGAVYAIFVPALSAGSIIFFYLFAKKFIYDGDRSKKHLIYLVPLIVSLTASSLSGARSGIVENFFMCFFISIYLIRKKNKLIDIKKLLFMSILTVVVFVIIFLFLGTLTKKVNEENYIQLMYIYGGSSIAAFSSWLTNADLLNPSFTYGLFGENSFPGIRNTLSRFLPFIEPTEQFLEFTFFKDGSSTNIYTGFRSYLNDFGIYGLPLICFFIGYFISFFYNFLKNHTTPLCLLIYAYFLKTFLYLVFAPSITSALLTPSQVFFLMWTIILGSIIIGKNFNKAI